MTRPKTISDEDILAAARTLFRAHGHEVATREIARAAGISEGVLYQRFGSKNELFFAAMAPSAPDLEHLLGASVSADERDARDYLKQVTLRMTEYFGEVLPLALRLISHPSFDHGAFPHAPSAMLKVQHSLARRLGQLEEEGRLRKGVAEPLSLALVRLAHDAALGRTMSSKSTPKRSRELDGIVDMLWVGAAPGGKGR